MESEIIVTESPNLKSLSQSPMDSTNSVKSNNSPMSSIKSGTNSVADSIKSASSNVITNFGWGRIFLIFFILAILGINIFSSLSNVTEWIGNTFGPAFKKLFGAIGITTVKASETVVDATATGAKTGIDVAAGTLTSGLDVIEGQLENAKDKNQSTYKGTSNNSLNLALSDATPQVPQPDDATSNTQRTGTGKSGYCYIGEDRGFRSCIKVNENDQCMSGDIFPSQAICVNPNLRE